jgi:glutathionyl-hydroquinone reductase
MSCLSVLIVCTSLAPRELFASLDRCEEVLSRQRYIAGNALTEADVRLFMTLIRFDEVYVVYFKTNKKFIHGASQSSHRKTDQPGAGGISMADTDR